MSIKTLNLTPKLYEYLCTHSLREPKVLQKLRAETASMTGYQMQISPEQGQFMALLAKSIRSKKTLDIGTFTGYSSLVVALALPDNGKLITCDISKESTEVAKRYWQEAGVFNKIDLRLMDALSTLDKLLENNEADSFDFVFIDADKRNYLNYYERSLKLIRKSGIIAIDNVLWSGAVADINDNDKDTVAIRELNDFILKDKRVDISMLPIGDGLTLVYKK